MVAANLAAINAKAGVKAASWEIVKVHSQVVAGTNWWFHLKADNGDEWSACIYEPLPHTGQPAEVCIVEKGHNPARNPNS